MIKSAKKKKEKVKYEWYLVDEKLVYINRKKGKERWHQSVDWYSKQYKTVSAQLARSIASRFTLNYTS